MNRKLIFIQGIILITITIVANMLLANWIFTKRFSEYVAIQSSLVLSTDHIFTALIYMERGVGPELSDKVKLELEAARKSLRAPELMTVRRIINQ